MNAFSLCGCSYHFVEKLGHTLGTELLGHDFKKWNEEGDWVFEDSEMCGESVPDVLERIWIWETKNGLQSWVRVAEIDHAFHLSRSLADLLYAPLYY